ncbi:MAG: NAD(P)-binding protein [Candidatus Margulisiibacteriota bacterium]
MNNKYDVLIVGAGFAGATAVNILAHKNKKVLIVEKLNHIQIF